MFQFVWVCPYMVYPPKPGGMHRMHPTGIPEVNELLQSNLKQVLVDIIKRYLSKRIRLMIVLVYLTILMSIIKLLLVVVMLTQITYLVIFRLMSKSFMIQKTSCHLFEGAYVFSDYPNCNHVTPHSYSQLFYPIAS